MRRLNNRKARVKKKLTNYLVTQRNIQQNLVHKTVIHITTTFHISHGTVTVAGNRTFTECRLQTGVLLKSTTV
jgi:hypothetical protein